MFSFLFASVLKEFVVAFSFCCDGTSRDLATSKSGVGDDSILSTRTASSRKDGLTRSTSCKENITVREQTSKDLSQVEHGTSEGKTGKVHKSIDVSFQQKNLTPSDFTL